MTKLHSIPINLDSWICLKNSYLIGLFLDENINMTRWIQRRTFNFVAPDWWFVFSEILSRRMNETHVGFSRGGKEISGHGWWVSIRKFAKPTIRCITTREPNSPRLRSVIDTLRPQEFQMSFRLRPSCQRIWASGSSVFSSSFLSSFLLLHAWICRHWASYAWKEIT